MKKYTRVIIAFFMCSSLVGCMHAQNNATNHDVIVAKQLPNKNCKNLGELSIGVGSAPTQLSYLKNIASQKGANIIVIKSQKWHYRKQISSLEPSTTVDIYDCT